MTEKILHNLAQAWSILLYPLWIPTYGMLLLMAFFRQQGLMLPAVWWAVCIGATFVITALIPLSYIYYLYKKGVINDLYIEDPAQRVIPYRATAVCYACWCYLIGAILHLPGVLTLIAAGATVAILLVALINRRWKISAHLTAMGGLIGGIAAYAMFVSTMPSMASILVMLLASLLLMYARLYLHAHTSMQVACGWILGLTCTFVPNLIMQYVQTH